MCPSEDELIPPLSELRQLTARKIRGLIRQGEQELAQLRLQFTGDENVSYSNADDPVVRQMQLIEESLKVLKLEAIRRRMPLKVGESPTDKKPTSTRKKPFRARDLEVQKRRDAIAQILQAEGGRPSTEFICKKLDAVEMALPERWREGREISLWTEAYATKELRPLVEKMISDDIAHLRSKDKSG